MEPGLTPSTFFLFRYKQIVVFAVLEPSNLFVTFSSVPLVIGAAYMVWPIIWFAPYVCLLTKHFHAGHHLVCPPPPPRVLLYIFSQTLPRRAFAADSIALNAARDVGGRLACSAVYGRKCWPGNYAALSALTNILATSVGASKFQCFFGLSPIGRRPSCSRTCHTGGADTVSPSFQ